MTNIDRVTNAQSTAELRALCVEFIGNDSLADGATFDELRAELMVYVMDADI